MVLLFSKFKFMKGFELELLKIMLVYMLKINMLNVGL